MLDKSEFPPLTFVLPGRNRSGGVRVTVDLGNSLLARGFNVRLAVGTPTGLRAKLRRFFHGLRSGGKSNDDWVNNFKGKVEPFAKLSSLAFEPGEVVIGVGSYVVPAVRDLSDSLHRIRFNHGLQWYDPQRMENAWRGEMPTLAVARTSAKILMKEFGISHVWIVPNGINLQAYYPDSTVKRDGIGTIYSPNPAKAPEDILTVMRRLATEFPGVPRYVFSAAPQPAGLECEEYHQLPPVDLARKLYSRSKVWLLMSKDEGLPGPVLEAMACGSVIISTDQAGSLEVIHGEKNGMLFPVGDVDACLRHVHRVMSDDVLRQSLVDGGLATVKEFTWERATEKFQTAISEIIAGSVKSALTPADLAVNKNS